MKLENSRSECRSCISQEILQCVWCGDTEIGENCRDIALACKNSRPREQSPRNSAETALYDFLFGPELSHRMSRHLAPRSLNLETVAVRSYAEPTSWTQSPPGVSPEGLSGGKVFQILPSILISEKATSLLPAYRGISSGSARHRGREEGYRNPVILPNPIVAADHRTQLPLFAPSQSVGKRRRRESGRLRYVPYLQTRRHSCMALPKGP